MSAIRNAARMGFLVGVAGLCAGCAVQEPRPHRIPSLEYTSRLKQDLVRSGETYGESFGSAVRPASFRSIPSPQVRFVKEVAPEDGYTVRTDGEIVTNMAPPIEADPNPAYRASMNDDLIRDYQGPLNYGEPGVSASLWKESRGGNDLFRDYRAFKPMDLITIVVAENTEGKKESDTEVKRQSTLSAAINNLFGIENWGEINQARKPGDTTSSPSGVDLSALINAQMKSDYKGEADTERKGRLRGKLSAMVVEVLPSGILRIEGEKIISMNGEDEHMVISGLVRPEDISSQNEVDSSKVANVRIDYFGKGALGDVDRPGWLQRTVNRLWPF